MALSAHNPEANKATNREQPEPGTYMARLVGLTDLGHQPGFVWQGKEIKSSFKVTFTYELVDTSMKSGRPFWVSEDISQNNFEGEGITSTMMARVRTLDTTNASKDGRELEELLGKSCMVTVSVNDKGYPKLKGQAAVSGVPQGMPVSELKNPTFSFDMDNPNEDIYNNFSDFTIKKLTSALNYSESALATMVANNNEF